MKDKLLYAGVAGPLLFIAVFLVEGATRAGYSAWTMYVSQLATGPGGWVQVANFLVFGAASLAFAVGVRMATASIAAPILLGLFAVAMFVAGIFTTDPGLGYPVGVPEVHTTHGTIHGFAGLAVFTLLPAACFVMGWRFLRAGSTDWALYSGLAGAALIALFFGGFAINQFAGAPIGVYQRAAIICGWTWISLVALHLIRADDRKIVLAADDIAAARA